MRDAHGSVTDEASTEPETGAARADGGRGLMIVTIATVVLLALYLTFARGAMTRPMSDMALAHDDAFITFIVHPSPLVVAVTLLLLAVAGLARNDRAPRWVSPVAAAASIVVPIAGFVATYLYVMTFAPAFSPEFAFTVPWWVSADITVTLTP